MPEPVDHPPSTLREYVSRGLKRAHAARPASVWLLFAMAFFLLAATVAARYVWHDPQLFFWFITVNLLFFFGIMIAALRDFRKIVRRYFYERREVYRTTLGETDFARELGRRVSERRDD